MIEVEGSEDFGKAVVGKIDDSGIVCEKQVSLLGQKYVVYLKKVASRVSSGGRPLKVVVRAFVKKLD